MTMLKQAVWLARKEIKYFMPAFIFTLITVAVLGLFVSLLVQHFIDTRAKTIFLDYLFVAALPSFGALFMSGPYLSFRAIKDNPFVKRLTFYRTLPISVPVLALSRMLFMLFILVCFTTLFFIFLNLGLSLQNVQGFSRESYLMFALFWFGYILALGGMNPLVEYGTNGKFLHIYPYLFVFLSFVVVIANYIVYRRGFVEWSIFTLSSYGWLPVVFMNIIGITMFLLFTRLLTRRLASREYE